MFPLLIVRPHIKRRLVVIGNPAKLLGHNLPENKIHAVQDFFPAAEILVQVNPLFQASILPVFRMAVRFAGSFISMEFLHEKLWP